MRSNHYKTKQQEEILECLKQKQGQHVTVIDIENYFMNNGIHVGKTTIYRHLEKMMIDGRVKKYMVDGVSGACYEYVDRNDGLHHFYLKCEKCYKLIPFTCSELEHVQEHLYKKHGFIINNPKTVFYGICKDCSREGLS